MTPQTTLIELLARVGAAQGAAVLISDEELRRWPSAAVAAMKSQGLLAKARPASSAICPGCERECVMPVRTLPAARHGTVSFIVCDKRTDINRVSVSIKRLTLWRCDIDAVCGFVAKSLGLCRSIYGSTSTNLLEIGIAAGLRRSQMLSLRIDDAITLVAANNAVSLGELVAYDGREYSIDAAMIRRLVDSAATAHHRYTPSNARREVRKLQTSAMYREWQKAYRDLQRQRPNMSDVWYSQQIAKQPLAKGRDAETIRKHLKK
jgi:hypothetical protein